MTGLVAVYLLSRPLFWRRWPDALLLAGIIAVFLFSQFLAAAVTRALAADRWPSARLLLLGLLLLQPLFAPITDGAFWLIELGMPMVNVWLAGALGALLRK